MANISLRQRALGMGLNSVRAMGHREGLDYGFSVRALFGLTPLNAPLAPVDLWPKNGAQNVAHDAYLFFRDPGAGTLVEAFQFHFGVTQNDRPIDPPGTNADWITMSPLAPPGTKYPSPLPSGKVTLHVWGENRYGVGPESTSTFTVVAAPPPPPPPPTTSPYQLQLQWEAPYPGGKEYVMGYMMPVPGGVLTKVRNATAWPWRYKLWFPTKPGASTDDAFDPSKGLLLDVGQEATAQQLNRAPGLSNGISPPPLVLGNTRDASDARVGVDR